MGKKQRRRERQEKLSHLLSIAAMIAPPWNIFWWLYGLGWYVHFKKHSDPNIDYDSAGDWSPQGQLMLAPIMFPSDIVMRYRHKKYNEYYKPILIKAVRWIVAELQKKGIGAIGYTDSPCVVARPKKSQVDAYREVYRRAIKEFPKIKISDICRHSKPLAPLDKAWAETAGSSEYAEVAMSPPCKQCSRQTIKSVFWGDDDDHAERHEIWEEMEDRDTGNLQYRKNNGEWVMVGYFCDDCLLVVEKDLHTRGDVNLIASRPTLLNPEELKE